MRDAIFTELLRKQWAADRMACVGLDPEMDVVRRSVAEDDTERAIAAYACAIVDATADLVCAYKPNIAFYERWGAWAGRSAYGGGHDWGFAAAAREATLALAAGIAEARTPAGR